MTACISLRAWSAKEKARAENPGLGMQVAGCTRLELATSDVTGRRSKPEKARSLASSLFASGAPCRLVPAAVFFVR